VPSLSVRSHFALHRVFDRHKRWRTGKPPKKPQNDEVYSLYAKGAELAHPGAEASIETLYLSTNEVVPNTLTEKQMRAGLQKYDDALADILRGDFSPKPSDWICPRCPHYFICPAVPFRDQVGLSNRMAPRILK